MGPVLGRQRKIIRIITYTIRNKNEKHITAPRISISPVSPDTIINAMAPIVMNTVPNTHQPDLPISWSLLTCEERLGRKKTRDSARLMILVIIFASEPRVAVRADVMKLTPIPTRNTNSIRRNQPGAGRHRQGGPCEVLLIRSRRGCYL